MTRSLESAHWKLLMVPTKLHFSLSITTIISISISISNSINHHHHHHPKAVHGGHHLFSVYAPPFSTKGCARSIRIS